MRKIWLYAGISKYLELVIDFGFYSVHTDLMPKFVTYNASSVDDQQATLHLQESPQRLYAKYPKREDITSDEATLLGILYTDGCLSKKTKNCWRFYLSNTSFEIIQAFRACMMKLFGLSIERVRISEKTVNGKPFYKAVVDSGYCGNIMTAKYGTFRTLAFKTEGGGEIYPSAKLPFTNQTKTKILFNFLKAAFSCDGGVNLYVGKTKKGYRFLVRNVFLSCKHPQLQKDYQYLLKILDINSKLLIKDNKIRIQRRENLEMFYKKIGFINGVKITQHSAYWQGWGKNKVLKLALSSYGNADKVFNLPQFCLG